MMLPVANHLKVFNKSRLTLLALAAVAISTGTSATAQDRAGENAVTQAEDAFGFSIGRESIGIYGPGNARGFSPTAAGNVRIDGLYYDPTFGLQESSVGFTTIHIGLSAQGYPFVAPSGIVDHALRRPASKPGASVIANLDGYGSKGVEIDGSLPLTPRLGLLATLTAGRTVFVNGTDNFTHSEGLTARWRPTDNIEIVPFWTLYNDYNDESGTLYVAAGSFTPKIDRPHHDEGPRWADNRFSGTNEGVLTNVALGKKLVVRLGLFRSSLFNRHSYTHLLVNEQPDGTANRILIADPPNDNRSLSGELRATYSIADGPRLHLIHMSIRRRNAHREFGGSDSVSFGVGTVGEAVTAPQPAFNFREQTRQHLDQTNYGIAYDGRWKGVGEISLSLSKANYRKVTQIPAVGPITTRSNPWLYNGTAAVVVSHSVYLYAGYARGLEESGVAPFNAANRNEPLEAILTRQEDAGIRMAVGNQVTTVLGVFELTRPYFGFTTANVFKRIGSVRTRGLEFSVSGRVRPRLDIVLGGVLLYPQVQADAHASGTIGSKPYGLPTHIIDFNVNWRTPFLKQLQLDLGVSHRGRQPATTDDSVYLPPRLNVNLGIHYGFKLARRSATLRVQVRNLFDNHAASTFGPGVFGPKDARQVASYLTVDL